MINPGFFGLSRSLINGLIQVIGLIQDAGLIWVFGLLQVIELIQVFGLIHVLGLIQIIGLIQVIGLSQVVGANLSSRIFTVSFSCCSPQKKSGFGENTGIGANLSCRDKPQ